MAASGHPVGACSMCDRPVYAWQQPWRVRISGEWLLVCGTCAKREQGALLKKHGEHLIGAVRTRDWRR